MLVFAIILIVLLLLALLRGGAVIEYGDNGFALWVKIGFLKIKVDTDSDSRKKKKKRKNPKPKRDLSAMKPGSLSEFMDMLGAVKNILGRVKRRLLIKELVLHCTFASEDPSKAALQFGAANAAIYTIVPVLERHFRIKRRDIKVAADFESGKPSIYALISISIAVWESIYILFALLPMLSKKDGKEQQSNGKGTYKQPAGHDDAENQGDDRC